MRGRTGSLATQIRNKIIGVAAVTALGKRDYLTPCAEPLPFNEKGGGVFLNGQFLRLTGIELDGSQALQKP
jgi:hypothetical protein